MKTISLLLAAAASLLFASCATDNSNKMKDMKGMDHGDMKNMTPEEHARMKM